MRVLRNYVEGRQLGAHMSMRHTVLPLECCMQRTCQRSSLLRVAPLISLAQVCAAWSLALLGGGDKETFGALFSALGARLAAAPDSVPVQQLALLAEAQVMAGDKAKLPDQVKSVQFWGVGGG